MQVPIVLNRRARTPLHRQIYDQWRDGILSGRFGTGERIPSTRELAELLRVSRSTVTTAYDQLTAEGYLQAERGSGSFVSRELPDRPLARKRTAAAVDEPPPVRLSRYGARLAAAPIGADVTSPPGSLDPLEVEPGPRRLPDPHLAPAGDASRALVLDAGLGVGGSRRRPRRAAARDRVLPAADARRPLRGRPGDRGQRLAAGARSLRARARRSGRRRGGRGSVLPGRAAAVRGARGAPASRAGEARRDRGVRAARRGAGGLRHAVAPAPDRRVDVAAAAARAAGLGARPRRRGDRGRLRQRIPLQRRAAAGAAGPRAPRPR